MILCRQVNFLFINTDDLSHIHLESPTISLHTPPEIMLSEIFLIFFVLAIWLSAIGFCLNQYKSLRRLETQVHYCVSRKDPLNIGEIKIVTREQDSIIYKKKRYSTILDTQINPEDLKAMHYVQQYLPKNSVNKISSALSNLVLNHDDVSNNIPLTTLNHINSLNTLDEQLEYQTSDTKISYIQRTGKNKNVFFYFLRSLVGKFSSIHFNFLFFVILLTFLFFDYQTNFTLHYYQRIFKV